MRFLFEISNFTIQNPKKKIIEITMMITRFGQMVNDKRLLLATTPIAMLCIIVSRRGLVRRSSANDPFYCRFGDFCDDGGMIFK
jgi:hypothetical protein